MMRGMKKAKQTTITCFCGEAIVLGVREKDLVNGARLFSKCTCGMNWTLFLRYHRRKADEKGRLAVAS
jgi:hypothetical protein